jgi:hypothetical protein
MLGNYEIFNSRNISIPADDFLLYLSNFKKYMMYNFWILLWKNVYTVWKAEILTELGLCYTFNIAEAKNVLNLNETSSDFHFQHFVNDHRFQSMKELETPLKSDDKSTGLYSIFDQHPENVFSILDDFDGVFVMIHNPYELPSIETAVNIHALFCDFVTILIVPEVINTDTALKKLDVEE